MRDQFFTLARRPKGQGYGRQRASCVRDDFDSYELCSGLAAMLPQRWETPHVFSAVYHRFFERKIPTCRPLEGFFNKKWHIWFFFSTRWTWSFWWTVRSLLQGLLYLWCTTSSWRTFAFWQALYQRYLDSSLSCFLCLPSKDETSSFVIIFYPELPRPWCFMSFGEWWNNIWSYAMRDGGFLSFFPRPSASTKRWSKRWPDGSSTFAPWVETWNEAREAKMVESMFPEKFKMQRCSFFFARHLILNHLELISLYFWKKVIIYVVQFSRNRISWFQIHKDAGFLPMELTGWLDAVAITRLL